MKKWIGGIVLIMLIVLGLNVVIGCNEYKEEWILGKNSNEVISRYGQFHSVSTTVDQAGLYRNCFCEYIIRNNFEAIFGFRSKKVCKIYFSEQGIATSCEIIETDKTDSITLPYS